MLNFLKFTEIIILLMTTILSSLPPGFRFHPTDEELILYLNNKVSSSPISVSAPSIISEIDLYKLDPWELPDKAYFGDRQWFCFSPRERKYPKGARPNRRAASGYWKATGSDRAIVCSDGWQYVGVKKSLIFYKGRAPKGTKTNWIMQEYRLPNSSPITGSMTLDEWVLCRIQYKGGVAEAAKEEGGSSSNSNACSFEGENWDEKSGTTSVKDALESIKRVLSLDEHEWASSNSSSF